MDSAGSNDDLYMDAWPDPVSDLPAPAQEIARTTFWHGGARRPDLYR
jgi:hypothetical protein